MKNNHQKRNKLTLFITKNVLIIFSLLLSWNATRAQSCLVHSMEIGTGTDPHQMVSYMSGSPDAKWTVTSLSAGAQAIPGAGGPPYAAWMIPTWGTWVAPNIGWNLWISFVNNANPTTNANQTCSAVFSRSFRTCGDDDITFNMQLAADNWISYIKVDGVTVPTANYPGMPTTSAPGNYTAKHAFNYTQHLISGPHTLEIEVVDGPVTGGNPFGLLVEGTINSSNPSVNTIVSQISNTCEQYVCDKGDPPGCNDICYWRVEANTIMNGNNLFGTKSNDDVKIVTNSLSLPAGTLRGIIKTGNSSTGGYFGWNTSSPTARWHVNCAAGNNPQDELGWGASDIRFENLEHGAGNILTIDGNGYVYNSGIGLGSGTYWDLNGNSASAANFFGTTNQQDIRFKTWGQQRMVLTAGTAPTSATSGFLGLNTLSPTARLHVNCNGGNEQPGFSDVRFQDLEPGTGNQLAIDANGYVYNSGIAVGGGTTTISNAWEVTGNAITGGNNIFGTTTADDVQIHTNGTPRGIITAGTGGYGPNDDGRFGIQTMSPTAHLHVNCRNGNPDGGPESDVRFEELEHGNGELLVIDPQGYVFNSGVHVNPDGTVGMKLNNEQEEKIALLETEVAVLKSKIDELLNCCSASKNSDVIKPAADGNILYQNTPNPFGKETVIEYYITAMQQSAYIMIYDLNGRELSRYPITATGKGKVTVNGENLSSGVYMYSLVLDGKEIDSKRMVYTK